MFVFVALRFATIANAQSYTIQQIGLTDPVHTTPSGSANQIGILNAAGQVTGLASRNVGGEDAWFYSPTTYSTQLIGLTDAVHVQTVGGAVNDAEDMNAAGQVLGMTARYSGNTFTGYDAWLFSSATNSTQVIGLLDAAHTQADGSYYNQAYHLNASGQVAGYAGRTGDLAGHDAWLYSSATNTTQIIGLTGAGYNGSFGGPNGYSVNEPNLLNAAGQVAGTATRITGNGPVLGYDAWLYSPTTNTTQRIGLQDPSGGYTVNIPSGMNATGQVAGSTAFYSDGGFTLSRRSAWISSPTTNATQQIGLVDAAHTQSDGYFNHLPIALNDTGQVAGTSNRFSGNTDQGQDAWLYSSKANSTQVIGLTDGAHTQTGGYSFNQVNGMNAVGEVIGFAKRYSGSADRGQDTWLYSPSTNTTQLIGLTDKVHTQVGGTSVNNTLFLNAGGFVVGTAKRYNGNSDPSMSSDNGIDSWLFDPVSQVTYNLISSLSATGFASSSVSYLGDNGVVLGTYNVNGGATQDAFLWSEAAGFHDLGNLVQGGLTAAGWTNLADAFGANGGSYIIGDGTLSNGSGMTFELAPVTALVGDYNHNGIVDAADYVVWRNGLGTTYTQNDYNVWRAHFGQTAGDGVGAGTSAVVPEPTTMVMLISATLVTCSRRRA